MLLGTVILIFITAVIIFYLVFTGIFVKEKYIDRIDDFTEKKVVIDTKKVASKSKGTVFYSIAKKIPKFKSSGRSNMELNLLRANLKLTVEELLIYRLLSSSAFTFLVFAIKKDYFLTIIVFFLVWQAPKLWIKNRMKKRLDGFNDQLNGGLILISNALKAGHSFMQALSISARETEGSFSEEFKILLKEMNFGIPIDIAMKNLLDRVDSKDMGLIVNAILIQKDIGGNLSEILENISETIRERQKIKNELKTLTAQGKMSGMIVMLLPIFLGGVIYLFNKEYMMLLFTRKLGLSMIGISLVNELIGVALIRKIVNIDV